MKTHALKMSVAFLCTLYMLACDETRQQAVTGLGDSPELFGPKNCVPDDPRPSCNGGGGGGGTSEDAAVTTTGGVVSDGAQAVQVKKDNQNQLKLQSSGAKGATASKNPMFKVEISLTGTETEAAKALSACTGDFSLKDRLIDGSKLRDFFMAIAGLDVGETGAGVLNLLWRPDGEPDQSFGVRVGTTEAVSVERLPDPAPGVRQFKFLTVDDGAPESIVSVSLLTKTPTTVTRLNCPTKDAIIVDVG